MKITIYKNNIKLAYNNFDSNLYYENIYSSLAVKFKLVTVDEKYFNNDLEGFKLRESLIVDKDIKSKVYNNSKDEIKVILDYINSDYLVLTNSEVLDYFYNLNGHDLGNIVDITDWLEEEKSNLDIADKMIIER